MANRRMINSDLFSDDVFMELNDITRLTWIGLIVMSADDQGRLQDNELLIKSQIFPMDNKTPIKIKNALDTLERNDMIHRYQKDGKKLIQIVNWWKHQTPSWASASNYPAPDNWVDREKYHAKGNEIKTTNWDKQGGFSELHSILPTERVTGLVGNESDVKSEVDVKSEGESTFEGKDKSRPFVDVYCKLTGLKPKNDKKEVEMIDEFIKLGITPVDYGDAIKGMQSKDYKIATMTSPFTWVMNERNKGKPKVERSADEFRQYRKGVRA